IRDSSVSGVRTCALPIFRDHWNKMCGRQDEIAWQCVCVCVCVCMCVCVCVCPALRRQCVSSSSRVAVPPTSQDTQLNYLHAWLQTWFKKAVRLLFVLAWVGGNSPTELLLIPAVVLGCVGS